MLSLLLYFFFFKQKTAYEMRISDWSSDVCSSDLAILEALAMNIPVVASDLPGMVEFNQISKARGYSSFVHLARSEDPQDFEIGRASCRERVCQYVEISCVAV